MASQDGLAVLASDVVPFTTAVAPVTVPEGQSIDRTTGATPITISDLVTVLNGLEPRLRYEVGYADGELYGFSTVREQVMGPVMLGETDDDKKTIAFHIYDRFGLPASGLTGEGAVCTPGLGGLQ